MTLTQFWPWFGSLSGPIRNFTYSCVRLEGREDITAIAIYDLEQAAMLPRVVTVFELLAESRRATHSTLPRFPTLDLELPRWP